MKGNFTHTFSTNIWQYPAPGGWFFASLPIAVSSEIRKHYKHEEEVWGRLKVKAQIGKMKWGTAIWFDTKQNCYLLPLKAEIRKKGKPAT